MAGGIPDRYQTTSPRISAVESQEGGETVPGKCPARCHMKELNCLTWKEVESLTGGRSGITHCPHAASPWVLPLVR